MITVDEGFVLRKISRADVESNLDVLLRMRNDVDGALDSLSRPRGQSEDDIRAWVRGKNRDSRCIFLGAFLEKRGLIGTISCTEESRIDSVGEIGIFLDKDARQKGYAKRMLTAFVTFLSDAHEYRKFVARVLDTNRSSRELFEASGFRLVGTLREHCKIRGRYVDLHIFERMASAGGCAAD